MIWISTMNYSFIFSSYSSTVKCEKWPLLIIHIQQVVSGQSRQASHVRPVMSGQSCQTSHVSLQQHIKEQAKDNFICENSRKLFSLKLWWKEKKLNSALMEWDIKKRIRTTTNVVYHLGFLVYLNFDLKIVNSKVMDQNFRMTKMGVQCYSFLWTMTLFFNVAKSKG